MDIRFPEAATRFAFSVVLEWCLGAYQDGVTCVLGIHHSVKCLQARSSTSAFSVSSELFQSTHLNPTSRHSHESFASRWLPPHTSFYTRLPSASLVKLLLRSVTLSLLWGPDGAPWGCPAHVFQGLLSHHSNSLRGCKKILYKESHMVPATDLSLSTLPQLALVHSFLELVWNLQFSICLYSAFGPVCDLSYLTCKLSVFGHLSCLESAECHLFGPV